MRTLYDEDIDYLEVVEEGIPNYAVQATPALLLFLSESDRTVVGFALENATERLKDLDVVPPKVRLAGILRLMRGVRHLNQEELAKITKIGVRTLQRAEAGDANLTFDNLINLAQAAPKIDLSVVLKPMRKVKGR
jgi:DNA-binding XRE family transcriptional regulator